MTKHVRFSEDCGPEITLSQSQYNEIFRGASAGEYMTARKPVMTLQFVGGVALWFLTMFSIAMVILR